MKVRMPMYANAEARKECQVSSITFNLALLRQGLSLNPKLTISSPARLVTIKPHQSIFLSLPPPQCWDYSCPWPRSALFHGHWGSEQTHTKHPYSWSRLPSPLDVLNSREIFVIHACNVWENRERLEKAWLCLAWSLSELPDDPATNPIGVSSVTSKSS